MDVELTIDSLELAPRVGEIILVSGDGDYAASGDGAAAPRASSSRSCRRLSSSPSMISDDLRRPM